MGRYIFQLPTLTQDRFASLSKRCAKVLESIDCKLAGWDGTGDPVFSGTEITFNIPNGTEETFSLTRNGDNNRVVEVNNETYNLAIKCCLTVFLFDIGDQMTIIKNDFDAIEWSLANEIVKNIIF